MMFIHILNTSFLKMTPALQAMMDIYSDAQLHSRQESILSQHQKGLDEQHS